MYCSESDGQVDNSGGTYANVEIRNQEQAQLIIYNDRDNMNLDKPHLSAEETTTSTITRTLDDDDYLPTMQS